MQERGEFIETHRFYPRSHEMKTVAPILTGEYLASGTRDLPPKELMQAMGMPVEKASEAKLEGAKVPADEES
ncbi:MAG: NADH-quinone oxidoreductase subunit B, partial [Phormidesmis sp.]